MTTTTGTQKAPLPEAISTIAQAEQEALAAYRAGLGRLFTALLLAGSRA